MSSPIKSLLWPALLLLICSHSSLSAEQSQNFTLQPGWNAIWLDPSPLTDSGDAEATENVFVNESISTVARPLLAAGSAEFASDTTAVFNQDEWLVWYRNPQSYINSLESIEGNQAYYVKVDGDSSIDIQVTGEVSFFEPNWVAGSYNLIGFNLSAAISFNDFFGADGESTGTHPINTILRLDPTTGAWANVESDDLMQPGEAYWVQSTKTSDFMGPVAISFDGVDSIEFGYDTGDLTIEDSGQVLNSAELTFSNISTAAYAPTMTLVDPADTTELQVYEVVTGADALSFEIGDAGEISTWTLDSIAAQSNLTVTLGAERNWTTGDLERENLYRVDIGSQYFWLPASAIYPDVLADTSGDTVDTSSAGLWIGEIILNAVSQIDDSTLEDTTSTAPMRIIIHVDESGNTSLLSHVMIMETKTADDSVLAETVLVVDPAKIPFYQGVVTRGGKQVGLRMDSAAFDMPRDYAPAAQTAILEQVAASDDDIASTGDVTADDIETFVNSQTARPSTLEEAYLNLWPLSGNIESGGALTTTSPLIIDPFHRSNPFRHAFHPQHAAGYAISRDISIVFDTSSNSDLISGFYTEIVSGLSRSSITTRGPITLSRITAVSELQ